MLSKSQSKLITSLKQKKYRTAHKMFVAEGIKTIHELLHSDLELIQLYTSTTGFDVSDDLVTIITPKALDKISFLKTSQKALGLFKIPKTKPVNYDGLVVVLDDLRDPGNLGTIIRLCDWFGIRDLVCSPETADCFNPKVIQASMGSIARVNISYTQLEPFLAQAPTEIFGTFMDAESIYKKQLPDSGLVIFGNEAHGISSKLKPFIKSGLSIPQFSSHQQTESLNVANALAIVLSEFRR
ncbi:MAG: RNA methyltransferase [Flavobacteriaceae bacterium]|nr:RNA methyltransferase [Bacteroidia bacterium]NNF76272.1 RNA methyltransferase [Flavobacteriaceae bacterium]NNK73042.1 RNA methyltransferase [Flavobacteriaceae bacterium]